MPCRNTETNTTDHHSTPAAVLQVLVNDLCCYKFKVQTPVFVIPKLLCIQTCYFSARIFIWTLTDTYIIIVLTTKHKYLAYITLKND